MTRAEEITIALKNYIDDTRVRVHATPKKKRGKGSVKESAELTVTVTNGSGVQIAKVVTNPVTIPSIRSSTTVAW